MKNFTIVIPVFNEEKNIIPLLTEIEINLKNYLSNFEVLIVNDCSTDKSADLLKKKSHLFPFQIKILNNKLNSGQSSTILNGIKNAENNTIVTIDGDGQNNPKDIIKLIDIYNASNDVFLVGGIRKIRKDSYVKIISSKLANFVRKKILKDDCEDTGCSLKVFDRGIFLNFPFFDGIHRFLPALFKGFGYKTVFVNVDHRERIHGQSKYGTLKRLYKGVFDMLKVLKILKENKND